MLGHAQGTTNTEEQSEDDKAEAGEEKQDNGENSVWDPLHQAKTMGERHVLADTRRQRDADT